jgi:hypothetical protein
MPDSLMERASDPAARAVIGVRTMMDAAHARGKLLAPPIDGVVKTIEPLAAKNATGSR